MKRRIVFILVGLIIIQLIACSDSDLQEVEAQNLRYVQEISDLKKKLKTYEDQSISFTNKINENEEKIVELVNRAAVLERDLNDMTNELDNLSNKNQELKEDLIDAEYRRIATHQESIDYFLYDEQNEGLSKEELFVIYSAVVDGESEMYIRSESLPFYGDQVQEDEIYFDESGNFITELEGYYLITEYGISTREDIVDYFRQWFTKSYSETIVDRIVGSFDERKMYLEYNGRVFTRNGGQGYDVSMVGISDYKSRVIELTSDRLVIEMLIPEVWAEPGLDGWGFDFYRINYLYLKEDGKWKYHERIDN